MLQAYHYERKNKPLTMTTEKESVGDRKTVPEGNSGTV